MAHGKAKMGAGSIFADFDGSIAKLAGRFEVHLRRPGIVSVLIFLFWACAVLPNLTVRSFIYEEGTNAEIARDVLAHGHFLQPFVYGIRWHEKPSLLAWLIAGFALLTGGVNEWSARLPAMLSVLLTALMVQRVTNRYASLNASLFAALSFVFCPLLLQKLTIAEPDTVITVLSFAALLLWWNGVAAGGVTIARWLGCGFLLAALALTKGPQPAGFFALGVAAYLFVARRWRDLPGFFVCMMIPAAATIAWGAAVYQPGDEGTWLSYARLQYRPAIIDYLARNTYNIGSLFLELLPASVMVPFIPWPWQRAHKRPDVPPIVAPLVLYSGVCTAILVLWPGFNTRYAMPIAPSLAVLAGMSWDALQKSRYLAIRRFAAVALSLFIVYQVVLVVVIMPLFADRFGETRLAGEAIERAIRAAPAPAYCLRLDTNILFYVREPFRCLDLQGLAALTPPAWLLIPHPAVAEFARLRPDLDVRIMVDSLTEAQLTATRVDKR
jgi:4-amino-4-deoxy-L-arabinose transferase-like glycosyltransferase